MFHREIYWKCCKVKQPIPYIIMHPTNSNTYCLRDEWGRAWAVKGVRDRTKLIKCLLSCCLVWRVSFFFFFLINWTEGGTSSADSFHILFSVNTIRCQPMRETPVQCGHVSLQPTSYCDDNCYLVLGQGDQSILNQNLNFSVEIDFFRCFALGAARHSSPSTQPVTLFVCKFFHLCLVTSLATSLRKWIGATGFWIWI